MALRGDLASVDLAQVFQMLALNKKVGLLSIDSDDRGHVLFFDERGVTVYHDRRRLAERVVAAAVRLGWLDPAVVDELRQQAADAGAELEERLLSGGHLREEEFVQQGRIELEEEIYDLFFCREARFEFHEGVRELEGVPGEVDERLFFHCDSVVMEAARRIDEWAYIRERIPSTGVAVFATVESVDDAQFGPDARAIHELMDGRRTVARIAALTGLTKFQVCKPLSQMLEWGHAALVDDAEAWFTSSDSSNNNVWRVFMDAPELVAPVAARAAASHEARRSLGLLAGRLRARHGWRAPASILEAASRALGEAMDDDE